MSKKVLVTGAAGFVGAALVKRLLIDGFEVYAVVKNNTDIWRLIDVSDSKNFHKVVVDLQQRIKVLTLIQKVKPAYVYHLATRGAYPTQNEAFDLLNSNIVGTWNLLSALSTVGCEFCVQTGSSSEYGFVDKPMSEADLPTPNSFYAVTKLANTFLAQYMGEFGKLPVVTARLFSVYGVAEEPSRLMPTVLKALHQNEVLKMAAPEIARDYIYLDDVIDFLMNVEDLKKYPGGVFNVGTGMQTSLVSLIETAEYVAGKKVSVQWNAYPARSWDSTTWVADMSHTFSNLSWRPKVELAQGLTQLYLASQR